MCTETLLVVAICVSAANSQGAISFIGDNTGSNGTWAVGVPELRFQYSSPIDSIVQNGLAGELSWSLFRGLQKHRLVTFNVENRDCNRTQSSNLTTTATCVVSHGNLLSNMTLNVSDWLEGDFKVTVHVTASEEHEGFNVSLKECPKGPWNSLILQTEVRKTFNLVATVNCSEGTLFRNSIESNGSVTCNSQASWDGLSEYSCWSAPNVTLLKSHNGAYKEKDVVNFTCVVTPGFPPFTTAKICIGDQYCSGTKEGNFTEEITMEPKYNGKYVRCEAFNNYTMAKNETVYGNDTSLLEISFGPHNLSASFADCTSFLNYSINATLQVEFSANPACITSLLGDPGFVYENTSDNKTRRNTYFHHFIYNVYNVPRNGVITVNCKDRPFATLVEGVNLSCPASSTKSPTVKAMGSTTVGTTVPFPPLQSTTDNQAILSEPETAAIVGAGVFLLVVLLVLLGYLIARRRSKAGLRNDAFLNSAFDDASAAKSTGEYEQKECQNVLYGTSDDLNSEGTPGGSTVKVIENVLYGTTPGAHSSNEVYSSISQRSEKKQETRDSGPSDSGLHSNETYAEVDKAREKKNSAKKAEKGQENPGFSGALKEHATYAAVDKKRCWKGNFKKSDDNSGSSGMVEEVTYAVVNKSKEDGSDHEDLHGSNKD